MYFRKEGMLPDTAIVLLNRSSEDIDSTKTALFFGHGLALHTHCGILRLAREFRVAEFAEQVRHTLIRGTLRKTPDTINLW